MDRPGGTSDWDEFYVKVILSRVRPLPFFIWLTLFFLGFMDILECIGKGGIK
jgi:hypothetical protein